jgi:hypothetical protein
MTTFASPNACRSSNYVAAGKIAEILTVAALTSSFTSFCARVLKWKIEEG